MPALASPTGTLNDIPQQASEPPGHPSFVRSLLSQRQPDSDVLNQTYPGDGTPASPYIIDYLHHDPDDALITSPHRKWTTAILHSLSTFALTFASSAYAPGIPDIKRDFSVTGPVATLGLSLFVLGFALGLLLWAPLSEVYGRKAVYVCSFGLYTAFSIGAACAGNVTSLLVLRFLASACGSSAMTNTGGIMVDMFSQAERGLATGLLYVTASFLGPALGPIAGGLIAETAGWRWILGLIAIMVGISWIATSLATRETYAPLILRRRADALSRMTGLVYMSRLDASKPPQTLARELSIALTRPWVLLFREPIVLLTSLYVSIIYGTLYMFFAGFPIIFGASRGWSLGISGLPFIGVAIGVCLATLVVGWHSKRYARQFAAAEAVGSMVDPEARLSTAMAGSIVLPIGLFLFAWTIYPSVPWILPVIGATVFSCGLIMVFVSFTAYLVDSYVVYAASVLAASTMLRSLLGFAFPLFTTQLYEALGNQWASSVPAFLVLVCVPVSFLFYKYGARIRSKCKYASEATKVLEMMHRRHVVVVGEHPNKTEREGEWASERRPVLLASICLGASGVTSCGGSASSCRANCISFDW